MDDGAEPIRDHSISGRTLNEHKILPKEILLRTLIGEKDTHPDFKLWSHWYDTVTLAKYQIVDISYDGRVIQLSEVAENPSGILVEKEFNYKTIYISSLEDLGVNARNEDGDEVSLDRPFKRVVPNYYTSDDSSSD